MTRRYGMLLGAIVVAALAITLVGRLPRAAAPVDVAPAALPRVDLALTIRDGRMDPERVAIPKNHEVALQVQNAGTTRVRLELAGYGVDAEIAAGAAWQGHFVSDRPGDDFAWILDGEPVGRMHVTGSHMVEGHR